MKYETCVTQFTDKQLHNLLFSPLLLRAPGGVLSLRMLSVSWNVQNMYKIFDDLLTPPFCFQFLAFNIL